MRAETTPSPHHTRLRVLVACEFSGVVRRAFRERGHDAWSCDLLPSDDSSPYHVQGDARDLLADGWDLLIAFPPCTRLCNSGVRWLAERDLWDEMRDACDLFLAFLNAPVPHVAVENPVMHGHARKLIGRGPDFTVQPWQYGHGEVKRTCFWTRNLPPLQPTDIVSGREARVHRASPGPDRWKARSVTYPGIAAAMAEQWGNAASTHHTRRQNPGASAGRATGEPRPGRGLLPACVRADPFPPPAAHVACSQPASAVGNCEASASPFYAAAPRGNEALVGSSLDQPMQQADGLRFLPDWPGSSGSGPFHGGAEW